MRASELKRGMVIDINGVPHSVKTVDVKSPSSRGAATLYKVRFTNLKTKQKLDESFKGDDVVKEADCLRTEVQYSYLDGDNYVFMDVTDYSQHSLPASEIGDDCGYLSEGLSGIMALLLDGVIIGVELPSSVQLTITETAPASKGATATGRTKPAKLTTGIEVQVPEYLGAGELVKINTETGKFMSRA